MGIRALIHGAMALCITLAGFAAAQTGSTGSTANASGQTIDSARTSLKQAKRKGDLRDVEAALDALHQLDAPDARQEAWSMVTSSLPVTRPIGSDFLARHSDSDELIKAIKQLDSRKFPDERRWLVRALGSRQGPTTRQTLEALLRDKDQLVRVAAAAALAELGDASAQAALRRVLPAQTPVETDSWQDDETASLQMVASGAMQVLEQGAASKPQNHGADTQPAFVKYHGQDAVSTPRFLIMIKASDLAPIMVNGQVPWPQIATTMDDAANQMLSATSSIFRSPMPQIRLILADQSHFAGAANVPMGFGGSCKGNEIVILLDSPARMAITLRHEYVHAVHQATFFNQPRWLAEGLAESLTNSSRASAWSKQRVTAVKLDDLINAGGVSKLIAWDTGGTTSPMEHDMYALAYVVVDFLRFGPFSARETRLAALMGRLSRDEPSMAAIRKLYGEPRELDASLRRWLTDGFK